MENSIESRADAVEPVRSLHFLAALIAIAAVLLAAVLWHFAMLFLSIAPANALTTKYQKQINGYVYPEFAQYWQLFAPNPLQQKIMVETRLLTAGSDDKPRIGPWVNLTTRDDAAIRHNPLPSHTHQNMLRSAWNFYYRSHDGKSGKPIGTNGELSTEYLKRIGLQRLGAGTGGVRPVGIQLRVRFIPVPAPAWSKEGPEEKTRRVTLPWWQVDEADCRGL
ncbi:DUF5819 family protein [Streptomyces sp. HB2AG]|uniref:DUF5819 family protein n=1 Tax=Streptomyces sp. HB2AG TaxID=2983400 RepID=UPI0022AAA240|nr:DUF5819 family protein [Streptomyces sp. HB2AG]MCZ2524804.1 DUF5819 family protein [Streptomyces sp. HB2AG]